MANLDSVSKRGSSIGLFSSWMVSLPIPDGTISQGDRQHTAWSYSGILAAEPLLRFRRGVGRMFRKILVAG